MKQRDTTSLVTTGCFLAVLLVSIAAGMPASGPGPEFAVTASLENYVPDAQFAQYLEYRVRLEMSSNCQ